MQNRYKMVPVKLFFFFLLEVKRILTGKKNETLFHEQNQLNSIHHTSLVKFSLSVLSVVKVMLSSQRTESKTYPVFQGLTRNTLGI